MRPAPLIATVLYVFVVGCNAAGTYNFNSAHAPWSITNSTDIQKDGKSKRIELRKEDFWWDGYKNSSRAEMSFNDYAAFGSQRWYKFSVYLPSAVDWKSQPRVIIGQIHNGKDGCHNYPPMYQYYNGRKLDVNLHYRQTYFEMDKKKYEMGCISKEIGVYEMDLVLDQWNDFFYEIKFSELGDGYVRMWLNGEQKIDYAGSFGFTRRKSDHNKHHYLKLGFYLQSPPKEPMIGYFDEIDFGRGPLPDEIRATLR